jgi:hypothetical protein
MPVHAFPFTGVLCWLPPFVVARPLPSAMRGAAVPAVTATWGRRTRRRISS